MHIPFGPLRKFQLGERSCWPGALGSITLTAQVCYIRGVGLTTTLFDWKKGLPHIPFDTPFSAPSDLEFAIVFFGLG